MVAICTTDFNVLSICTLSTKCICVLAVMHTIDVVFPKQHRSVDLFRAHTALPARYQQEYCYLYEKVDTA
jgi:hypothetical protein